MRALSSSVTPGIIDVSPQVYRRAGLLLDERAPYGVRDVVAEEGAGHQARAVRPGGGCAKRARAAAMIAGVAASSGPAMVVSSAVRTAGSPSPPWPSTTTPSKVRCRACCTVASMPPMECPTPTATRWTSPHGRSRSPFSTAPNAKSFTALASWGVTTKMSSTRSDRPTPRWSRAMVTTPDDARYSAML